MRFVVVGAGAVGGVVGGRLASTATTSCWSLAGPTAAIAAHRLRAVPDDAVRVTVPSSTTPADLDFTGTTSSCSP